MILFYKGGSYLFIQKYIHDLNAFEGLSTEEQEKVIGRFKLSDIEMPETTSYPNSHIALANVGEEFRLFAITCLLETYPPMKWALIYCVC